MPQLVVPHVRFHGSFLEAYDEWGDAEQSGNDASIATIERANGVYEDARTLGETTMLRYWVDLGF